jgi:hypothetical protein
LVVHFNGGWLPPPHYVIFSAFPLSLGVTSLVYGRIESLAAVNADVWRIV